MGGCCLSRLAESGLASNDGRWSAVYLYAVSIYLSIHLSTYLSILSASVCLSPLSLSFSLPAVAHSAAPVFFSVRCNYNYNYNYVRMPYSSRCPSLLLCRTASHKIKIAFKLNLSCFRISCVQWGLRVRLLGARWVERMHGGDVDAHVLAVQRWRMRGYRGERGREVSYPRLDA